MFKFDRKAVITATIQKLAVGMETTEVAVDVVAVAEAEKGLLQGQVTQKIQWR